MSFVDWRSFKTNKRVILFYRELVSRSRNLNQHKSRSLLESERHFNVEVGIYYFYQFTILTPFLSCWLINLGIFLTGKNAITNFLNPLNIYRYIYIYMWVPVSSTDKVSDGCIRDLGFNFRLHQKPIGVLV